MPRRKVPHMCITCQNFEPCNLNDDYIGYLHEEDITKCRAWRLSENYKKGGKFYKQEEGEQDDNRV